MSDEAGVFVDGESSTGYYQQELSFRSIVLNHLIRINNIACKEFYGGYWTTRVKGVGNATYSEKVYVPDVLQEYVNAVNQLGDLLLPYFDDEMTKAEDNHLKALEIIDLKDRGACIREKREFFRSLSKFLKRQGYLEVGDLGATN